MVQALLHSSPSWISAGASVSRVERLAPPKECPPASGSADVRVHHYETLIELRRLWTEHDVSNENCQQTFVLVLDENFAGDLPYLVSRQEFGYRLVLAIPSGRLPGFLSAGDLAARCLSFGWRSAVTERSAQFAVQSAVQTLQPGEQLVVFWPQWRSADALSDWISGQ
jgi:hypothetical protein